MLGGGEDKERADVQVMDRYINQDLTSRLGMVFGDITAKARARLGIEEGEESPVWLKWSTF